MLKTQKPLSLERANCKRFGSTEPRDCECQLRYRFLQPKDRRPRVSILWTGFPRQTGKRKSDLEDISAFASTPLRDINGSLVSVEYPTAENQNPPEISKIEFSDFQVVGEKRIPFEIGALRDRKDITRCPPQKLVQVRQS
jgi:hypothetical protein